MKKLFYFIYAAIATIGICFSGNTYALVFTLPPQDSDIVGKIQEITTVSGDNFHTIGRRYDVGYYELIEANPDISPESIPEGTHVVIPTRFILPNAPRQGIIVNLPELRLYYFPPGENQVWTYPIGIGRQGWLTPTCTTTIISKKEKPTWIVPKSIQADRAKQGVKLPDKVLPGPENPLGDYALRLGLVTYLIHGTNDPDGVGRRSSAGCIRMFPEDVKELFKPVKVGTPVRIMNDSYKLGWHYKKLYLETHLPLQEQKAEFDSDLTPMVQAIMTAAHENKETVNWDRVDEAVECQSGLPLCISKSVDANPLSPEEPTTESVDEK